MAKTLEEAIDLAHQRAISAGIKTAKHYAVPELSEVFDKKQSYFRSGMLFPLGENTKSYNAWKKLHFGHEKKGHLYNKLARAIADKRNVFKVNKSSWAQDILKHAPADTKIYAGDYANGYTHKSGKWIEGKAVGLGGYSTKSVEFILKNQLTEFITVLSKQLPTGWKIISVGGAK